MTKQDFTKRVIEAAVINGVVDEQAVEDAEGYDHELTLGRLRGMAEALFAQLQDEPKAESPKSDPDFPLLHLGLLTGGKYK